MIPIKYAYIAGCLLFAVVWALLFWHRRDLRKAMLSMGVIFGFASLFTAYYWTIDWWRPLTITGTRIGFEDFFLGFTNGGIATVMYVELLHKRYTKAKTGEHAKKLLLLTVASYGIFWLLFHQLRVGSIWACFITTAVYSAVIIYLRRDLFFSSVVNGLMMVVVAAPVYFLSKILSPNAIEQIYVFPLHPDIRILGVPAQEFIFYFAFGFMVPLVYEYWHNLRLSRQTRTKRLVAQKALSRA